MSVGAERVSRAAPGAYGGACAARDRVIVVGASTGGTDAIREFLARMPADAPPILITQHMPENFTRAFAARLDRQCTVAVSEARDGERLLPGHALIAPGHSHLLLKRDGAGYVSALADSAPVNRHRPSVDVLFQSAARAAGAGAVGVILTGMGRDGAAGMLEMHRTGARTFAQDEASCVVFGMPREAIALGGVDEVVALPEMAARVLAHLAHAGRAGAA